MEGFTLMTYNQPPSSWQLDDLMGRKVTEVTYTVTNLRHGNGRPVIHYGVRDSGAFYANDAVKIAKYGPKGL
jgi:hypothetical protein